MSLKILLDIGRDALIAFEREFIFHLIKGVKTWQPQPNRVVTRPMYCLIA